MATASWATAPSPVAASPFRCLASSNIIAIAAGSKHTLALKQDGTVWAWGDNSSGQLGDGTTTHRTSPVQVPGLTGVSAIAAGRTTPWR